MALQSGTIVDGRYRLLARVGAGGMAEVWSAHDSQLDRRVALKLLHERHAVDASFVERFRREASAAANLQHPNIVQVYDRGEWEGTYYIAMEFISGRSLKELVVERGRLAPEQAVTITIEALKALRFAHRNGLVHRDIKPHNVILDDEGRVKVTDFGIAQAGASDMTETGTIVGTAQYLSPEQAQGHSLGPSSDLYSTGVTLFELLCGRVPFEGESPVAIALKHVSEPPPAPSSIAPGVPRWLDAVVLRALAKDPGQRYESAEAMISALQAGDSVAPPTAVTQVAPAVAAVPVERERLVEDVYDEPEERRAWPWIVAALLVLLALALAGFLATRPEMVTVPDVEGETEAQAQRKLRISKLEGEIIPVADAEVRRGRVVSQDPIARKQAPEGSTVLLRVSTGPERVAVPDVEGKKTAQARDELEEADFEVEVDRVYSDTVDKGRVVRTVPPAGTEVEKGETVRMEVSRGPQDVVLPNVQEMNRREATEALERLGLEVEVRESETDAEEPREVLDQQPPAGTKVPAESTVTITVAKKIPKKEIPDVTDMSPEEARRELEDAGFRVKEEDVEVTDPSQDGVVVEQDPEAGEKRSRDAQVTIGIGRLRREPTPTPEPEPEPEPELETPKSEVPPPGRGKSP